MLDLVFDLSLVNIFSFFGRCFLKSENKGRKHEQSKEMYRGIGNAKKSQRDDLLLKFQPLIPQRAGPFDSFSDLSFLWCMLKRHPPCFPESGLQDLVSRPSKLVCHSLVLPVGFDQTLTASHLTEARCLSFTALLSMMWKF